MPHLWSTHTGETAWPHVEKENAVIFLYFLHIKVLSTSVFCAAITCWPLCTRAKESFDWLCNTKRRLIQYIRARCAFKMLEYSVCWCYVHATLTERLPRSHTWKVGEDHDSTRESSEYLKSLTQQAVILQKAINHIYSNTPSACIPPPKVCALL